jgi:hypothetical protein
MVQSLGVLSLVDSIDRCRSQRSCRNLAGQRCICDDVTGERRDLLDFISDHSSEVRVAHSVVKTLNKEIKIWEQDHTRVQMGCICGVGVKLIGVFLAELLEVSH